MTLPGHPEARLASARHPDEETRYRAVLELDGAHPAELDELFARLDDESWRVRSAAVERLGALAEPAPALARLVAALTGADSPGGRAAAGAALVQLGGLAMPALVERLGSGDVEVVLAVAPVVGALGDRRAVPALAARLAAADPNVRAAAAAALGQVGGPEAAAGLLAALDSDDVTLQGAALDALAGLRVAPPVWRLTRLMGDRALRPAAYRTLGPSDDAAALEVLAGGLSERSRSAREAALGAIGQQRARRGPEALVRLAAGARAAAAQDPSVAEACVAALASEEPFVAAGALTVLAWVGDARHGPAMARLAGDDRHRPLVEEALDALPRGSELLAALAGVLPELSPLARVTVHGALAGAGQAEALQSLVYGASDLDPQVQAEAIAALGRLGDARAVPALGGLLGDDLPALSGVAASALSRIAQRSPEGRSAVLVECRTRAAASPSAAIYRILGAAGEGEDLRLVRQGLAGGAVVRRMAAAGAVAAIGQRGLLRGEHVPELIDALSDPAWAVRASAARAFVALAEANADRRLGDPEEGEHPLCVHAMAALTVALTDPEPAVQAAAVDALGACGRPEHAARIAAVVTGTAPPQVVVAGLHALSRFGPAPVELVERALGHADPEVAKEAVAAAGGLPGQEGRRLLGLAAASPRWDVRHAAARAIGARGDAGLRQLAARLAADDPDPLVARAFEEAVRALAGPPRG
ncbi:MAG: HEAT repeat domain-containing protein [Anaeromyxobacter sp.]|nr:HEAT repeat domain-containing protein [Anaeromyxobacter sp.]